MNDVFVVIFCFVFFLLLYPPSPPPLAYLSLTLYSLPSTCVWFWAALMNDVRKSVSFGFGFYLFKSTENSIDRFEQWLTVLRFPHSIVLLLLFAPLDLNLAGHNRIYFLIFCDGLLRWGIAYSKSIYTHMNGCVSASEWVICKSADEWMVGGADTHTHTNKREIEMGILRKNE